MIGQVSTGCAQVVVCCDTLCFDQVVLISAIVMNIYSYNTTREIFTVSNPSLTCTMNIKHISPENKYMFPSE